MADPSSYRPAPGTIPTQPGVYRFSDEHGQVIYVGKAKNLKKRLASYFRKAGLAPFGMFEITAAGLIMAAAGMIYLLTVGRHLLPERDTLSKLLGPRLDRNFMTELRVPLNSPVIGKTIAEANLNGGSGLQVLKLFREEQDVRELIKLKGVYELMETITDKCEEVANTIEGIVLENS